MATTAPEVQSTAHEQGCDRLQEQLPELASRGETRALCVETREANPADGGPANSMMAAAVPERCMGDYPNDAWIIDRFVGCHRELVLLRVVEVPSGQQIGEVDLSVVNSLEVDPKTLTWNHSAQVFRVGARGDVNGVIANAEATCDTGCTVATSTPPSGLVLTNPQGSMTANSIVDPAVPGSVVAGRTSWTISYTQMGAAPSEPAVYTSEPVRCDNATPNAAAGCVLARYTPTLTYSFANNGELAQHVADAQASGLPGSPISSALTRQTDPELINKNRNTACPGSLPRPDGTECDEYPFASTNQGAFLGNGYSQRMILAGDNQQGGRELAAFYRTNRVMNFDPFYVEVVGS
ncbi:hypothetical protein BJ969_003173 [Saccharopolyspora gloriosae]|uniref:Deoxyribonuclease NucA/NucB domain-containing protein n=1 Tax=Saccharopolyspora gloriosae TaxID=455344 RepID=A0A840NJ71_9PSEU|nr:hypothetical protein [Saccharopolyspora gloriosae]